jgi:glycosyltransferase involved in cell wall biosynthesis
MPSYVDEVVIVDGRSLDGTVDVARALRLDVVVVSELRPGKGNAVRAGFAAASGDIIVMLDGDGSMDALVGVIKKTRFHREEGRRIFIFKQVDGKVRPLWLGSRLGAELVDFRFVDGCIRALETDGKGKYAVIDYQWKDFGPAFKRFIVKNTNQKNAIKQFNL